MWRCRALNSNRVLIETSLKKMTFTERRAQLSELLGTPLSPGYRSVAFVSGTRRRTIPPLATQHDTSLEGGGGRTRGSRPTADGTLTEKTSKRRGDGRAACKASRGGGGGGGERAEGAERERGFVHHHHHRHHHYHHRYHHRRRRCHGRKGCPIPYLRERVLE